MNHDAKEIKLNISINMIINLVSVFPFKMLPKHKLLRSRHYSIIKNSSNLGSCLNSLLFRTDFFIQNVGCGITRRCFDSDDSYNQ